MTNFSYNYFQADLLGRQLSYSLYQPSQQRINGLLVFFHGGGYVVGNLASYDWICSNLCQRLGTPVISLGYRLSPEAPYPAPIEDGYDFLVWLKKKALSLGLRHKHLVLVGDSAGGHLALSVAMLARDKQQPIVDFLCLIYPWLDNDLSRASYSKFREGFGLTTACTKWFYQQFMPNGVTTQATIPRFPLHGELSDLPPTYLIAAENDILLDEILEFKEVFAKLNQSPLYYSEYAGMIHGFFNHFQVPVSFVASNDLIDNLNRYLSQLL